MDDTRLMTAKPSVCPANGKMAKGDFETKLVACYVSNCEVGLPQLAGSI